MSALQELKIYKLPSVKFKYIPDSEMLMPNYLADFINGKKTTKYETNQQVIFNALETLAINDTVDLDYPTQLEIGRTREKLHRRLLRLSHLLH